MILEFVELRFPLYYVQYGTVVFIRNIPQIGHLRFCKFFAYIYVGSTFGLKLIINVEEYEYMPGPYSDAGIKVRKIYCTCCGAWCLMAFSACNYYKKHPYISNIIVTITL